MTTLAADSRLASGSLYRILIANFDAAYRNLKNSLEAFNNALEEVPTGLTHYKERSPIDRACRAYEDARQEFLIAVGSLNEFLIDEIIASRSDIPETAPRE